MSTRFRSSSLSALGLLAIAALGTPARAASHLRWAVAADDFVHFKIEEVSRTDSLRDGYARWGLVDDISGFHGYELDRAAVRVDRLVEHPDLLAMSYVFWLPPRARVGSRSLIKETRPANVMLGAIGVKGDVRVLRLEGDAGSRKIHLQGAVVLRPARDKGEAITSYRSLESGRIAWTATYDEQRELMTEVDVTLAFKTVRAQREGPSGVTTLSGHPRAFELVSKLRLARVLPHRYAGFQRDVDKAIELGVTKILQDQTKTGQWRASRPFGDTALALLALVDSGRPAEDPAVVRGFDWLLAQKPWDDPDERGRTYALGIALMAIETRRVPLAESASRRRGETPRLGTRVLTDKERAFAEAATRFLVATARTGVRDPRREPDPEPRRKSRRKRRRGKAPVTDNTPRLARWGYPRERYPEEKIDPHGYYDNSNTQYAVLGLAAAARCKIRVPEWIWIGVARHFLRVQAPDGPARKDFVLVPHVAPTGRTTYAERLRVRRRGWNYGRQRDPEPGTRRGATPYGAMTTAGIASLAIARGYIAEMRHAPKGLVEQIDRGIRDGFASLGAMFSVWDHPHYSGWYTYYLYGLERAGMLAGIERFGRHDWYWEGAVQLLLRQRSYYARDVPHWSYDMGSTGTTCWAVLFLRRGTIPVITPR